MLKNVELKAKEFEGVEEARKALKAIQSRKCRFKKQKAREDYEVVMAQILEEEQLLKEVVAYFEPKKTFVTTMTQEDIDALSYEETLKAIKSIQSKKCNSQYDEGAFTDENSDYNKACRIEEMLKAHKEEVAPVDDTVVKKSKIQNLIRHVENQDTKITRKYVLELLNELLVNDDFMSSTK